jgi:hypothetical protein
MLSRVTDVIDLVALLLLVLAGALFVADLVGTPAGLASGGVGLLVVSWIVERKARP